MQNQKKSQQQNQSFIQLQTLSQQEQLQQISSRKIFDLLQKYKKYQNKNKDKRQIKEVQQNIQEDGDSNLFNTNQNFNSNNNVLKSFHNQFSKILTFLKKYFIKSIYTSNLNTQIQQLLKHIQLHQWTYSTQTSNDKNNNETSQQNNNYIFKEGQKIQSYYFLIEGSVNLTKTYNINSHNNNNNNESNTIVQKNYKQDLAYSEIVNGPCILGQFFIHQNSSSLNTLSYNNSISFIRSSNAKIFQKSTLKGFSINCQIFKSIFGDNLIKQYNQMLLQLRQFLSQPSLSSLNSQFDMNLLIKTQVYYMSDIQRYTLNTKLNLNKNNKGTGLIFNNNNSISLPSINNNQNFNLTNAKFQYISLGSQELTNCSSFSSNKKCVYLILKGQCTLIKRQNAKISNISQMNSLSKTSEAPILKLSKYNVLNIEEFYNNNSNILNSNGCANMKKNFENNKKLFPQPSLSQSQNYLNTTNKSNYNYYLVSSQQVILLAIPFINISLFPPQLEQRLSILGKVYANQINQFENSPNQNIYRSLVSHIKEKKDNIFENQKILKIRSSIDSQTLFSIRKHYCLGLNDVQISSAVPIRKKIITQVPIGYFEHKKKQRKSTTIKIQQRDWSAYVKLPKLSAKNQPPMIKADARITKLL